MNNLPEMEGPVCPLPLPHKDTILLGHGSGGKLTHDLIQQVFKTRLANSFLADANDSARVSLPATKGRLAVTTDSHIVKPLFFPGGDIGRLAVAGTVNDLAMVGSTPLYLTAGFIIEEGFTTRDLERIVDSMQTTAVEAGVSVIAGDTKVVERGFADGLFINTTGVGWIPDGIDIGGQNAMPGDIVLVNGTLGDHGIAVLSARGDLGIDTDVVSDVAPLNHLVQALISQIPDVHVLRDATRGGLATTLNEIAAQSAVGLELDEEAIPVHPSVRSACDLLGFDPMYIANEGKMVIILPAASADLAYSILTHHPLGLMAMRIGRVVSEHPGTLLMKTLFGGSRILDMLAGEILPRIC